jgi:hypothetical protein
VLGVLRSAAAQLFFAWLFMRRARGWREGGWLGVEDRYTVHYGFMPGASYRRLPQHLRVTTSPEHSINFDEVDGAD